ncbi:MAG: hypothetical protein AMXMBFR50_23740 [Ignavibacterium album]
MLSENKIEEQLKLFAKYGDEIITSCRWVRFKDKPNEINIIRQNIDKDYANTIEWLIDSWSGKGVGQTGIWLVPRKILVKAGKWNEQLLKNQDGEFFCRVILQSNKIIFSKNTLAYYRDTRNSITNKFNYEAAFNTLLSYDLYIQHLSKYLDQKKVKLALASNFSSFYAYVYPFYPDLLIVAEKRIKELGFKNFPLTGGRKFKVLSAVFGVKKATFIRRKLSLKHKMQK